jgi:phage gp29-like protein
VTILDHTGRPFTKETIASKGGRAYSVNSKDDWQESVAAGITPARLAEVLRSNDAGDNRDLLTLAGEMEERDPHWFAQLQTRINAIAFTKIRVEPRRKDRTNKQAKDIAEVFQEEVVDKASFRWLLTSLMDGIKMGYSVVQPVWNTSTRPWTFQSFEHIDPRAFQYDTKEHKHLRLRDDSSTEGRPLPPGLFLVHKPHIRTGAPLRASLTRLGAVNWFFKVTSVSDWLAFAEVYGMPIRIGRYDSRVTDDELATLRNALVNLGHDASAMIPKSMDLEIVDARRPTSGDNVYTGVVSYLDQCASRVVLGQVLAADARATGLGTAIADLHREVRQDILEADALAILDTLEYLLRIWVQLNYGLDAPVPRIRLDIEPPADLQKFTTAVLPWFVQGGIPIGRAWLYEHLQIPEPEESEDVVKAPLAPGTPGAGAAGPVKGVKSVSTKQRVAAAK